MVKIAATDRRKNQANMSRGDELMAATRWQPRPPGPPEGMGYYMPEAKLNGIFKKSLLVIIAVVSTAFGAGVAMGVMNYRVDAIESDVADHELRLRNVERAAVQADSKLDAIDDKLDQALKDN